MKKTVFIIVFVAMLFSCAPKHGNGPVRTRSFKIPEVPAIVSDPEERAKFLAENWWNDFFSGTGPTDTGLVLGVSRAEVESAFSNYVAILNTIGKQEACTSLDHMFTKLEDKQAEDTTNHVFTVITGLMCKYLYDPNSPLRDEDLYLPVAGRMARSPYTIEDARPAYFFEERMCMLNRFGEKVPDFRITDVSGRSTDLYDIKAGMTLVFFSNPGCPACKDIMDELISLPYLDDFIRKGRLAVVSMYIDEEMDKWREHEPDYPRNWINGYDSRHTLRSDKEYYIRAIPSLYLLDAQKRVVLKDAPVERVIEYIENN